MTKLFDFATGEVRDDVSVDEVIEWLKVKLAAKNERQKLLDEAAEKPIRSFVQMDYFNQNTGVGDHDNDWDLFSSTTRELNRSGCLRLLIPTEGYTAEDVLNGVRRMLKWLESDYPPSGLVRQPAVRNGHTASIDEIDAAFDLATRDVPEFMPDREFGLSSRSSGSDAPALHRVQFL